jgi:hypothetical protein
MPVLLWFAGVAWLLVWRVFRSPAVDYRLVVVGACLPSIDLLIGRATPLHSVSAAVVALAAVMAVGRGRRLAQRRWLSIPIGMFAHLVLDATWADTALFWWPVSGADLAGLEVPEMSWPVSVALILDGVGVAVLVGLWFRLGLTEPENRDRFRRTGHLARELA